MAIVIDGNNTPTAGGIGYGDGTELAFTTAGSSGQPVVSGGSGAPAFRPYTLPAADGSASQVLQTNGSGALSFATPSSSALVFISSVTASSSASLTFTSGIDSTYACYLFEFVQVRPASDGPYFNMRTSSDGGSSYDSTSGDYVWVSLALSSESATANVQNGSTTATLMALTTSGVGNSTNENGVSGFLRLWAPSASAYTVQDSDLVWTGQSTNNCCGRASGMRKSTSSVNAVRFLFDSGNITSGTIRMYGVANS